MFGSYYEWQSFEEIVWGRTDGYLMRNGYIAVYKDGSYLINTYLPSPLKDRLFVKGNVSRNGCNLKFVLKNVTWPDDRITYGCQAIIDGYDFRSGPIELVIQGKAHLFMCVKLSFYKCDHPRSLPHKISVQRDLFKQKKKNEQQQYKVIISNFHLNRHTLRFLTTGLKVRITLYSITNSTTGKYFSVAFIHGHTLGFNPQTKK